MNNSRRTTRVQENQDLYSLDANLINKAERDLSDGIERDPITKLRLLCYRRGPTGMMELAKNFRKLDVDGSKKINKAEFRNAIIDSKLDVPDEDLREMFEHFDGDGCGTLPIHDFLTKLRPPMPERRLAVIDLAFEKIDKNNHGAVTPDEVRRVYSVKEHRKYQADQLSEDEIITEFLNNFEAGRLNKGYITKEEFVNYYAAISASIDDNNYFDLLMRHTYLL